MKTLNIAACFLISYAFLLSCAYNDLNDKADLVKSTDEELYQEISKSGYTYYQGGQLLAPAAASPHGSFKLRFNEIAWSALDQNGELPVGQVFPEGSIIVKEVHTSGSISLYAVMKKSKKDINSANGWLWSEYTVPGSAQYSINSKGAGCTNCHSQTANRDLVRTFDLH
jgi:hypothetical protein